MYGTSDIRKGLRIEIDGAPYTIIDFQFVKPGKGNAFTRTKIKNLITGAVLDRTFKTGEKMQKADTEEREMQFLYKDSEFHFMDNNTYEQISLESDLVGNAKNFLMDSMNVNVSFFKGNPVALSLPNFVDMAVTETPPGEKGNTVTGATKPATLSSGHVVQVPLFINEGELLKIDTRTGSYVERTKK